MALFNPEYLKQKVEEAKDILDITDESGEDLTPPRDAVSSASPAQHHNGEAATMPRLSIPTALPTQQLLSTPFRRSPLFQLLRSSPLQNRPPALDCPFPKPMPKSSSRTDLHRLAPRQSTARSEAEAWRSTLQENTQLWRQRCSQAYHSFAGYRGLAIAGTPDELVRGRAQGKGSAESGCWVEQVSSTDRRFVWMRRVDGARRALLVPPNRLCDQLTSCSLLLSRHCCGKAFSQGLPTFLHVTSSSQSHSLKPVIKSLCLSPDHL